MHWHGHTTMIISHWIETSWIITHRITLRITNTIFEVLYQTYPRWKHSWTKSGILWMRCKYMAHIFFIRLNENTNHQRSKILIAIFTPLLIIFAIVLFVLL
jgi:hypothetical protein